MEQVMRMALVVGAVMLMLGATTQPTTAPATQPGKWTPVFHEEDWYKANKEEETIFSGTLEALPEEGPTTLMRSAFYRLGDRTLYTGGKRAAALDALAGKKVEIQGKAKDMALEGQQVREIWPGAVRSAE